MKKIFGGLNITWPKLVLVSPDGEETVYDLKVENYSYEISRRDG